MAAPEQVHELIKTFDRNIDAYKDPQYNETQLRREFIDPFFEALGWDVQNKSGYAPAYKDVIHEDAIKIGGHTKAPDYCFRIGSTRKFFVETKKPSIDIRTDPHPAYQLRRYAWSAKLPLSILTDFEEFAVYDCQTKPGLTDGSSAARIMFLTYKDYLGRWDDIANIFSKEAVLKGSFDKFITRPGTKKGTTTVDKEFLSEIEEWRKMLARTITHRNRNLSFYDINFAVQRTIDRILFLRMCEDRAIESYGQLLALTNGDVVYQRLCNIFRQADAKYNSGLFHFQQEKNRAELPDELTLNITVDDAPLRLILGSLYYPKSPYEFSVLPPEILGNVYEQFLGKVIRITPGRQAKIEDKPEVKKAGGVYYTPSYIVDYIIQNTVGKLTGDPTAGHCESAEGGRGNLTNDPSVCHCEEAEGRRSNLKLLTPKQIENLKILDPACGSGSFLLGAYTYLLNYIRDWYVENDPAKHREKIYQGRGGQWFLTISEKKRILLDNIFGVDIDPQAVEVTKLSLLLKVLEGETGETIGQTYRMFHERALPDLGNNIKCGNSLIGPDFFDNLNPTSSTDELRQKINPFNYKTEFPQIFSRKTSGFDAVIGNPPWGAQFSEPEQDYLIALCPLVPTKTKDSYLYFLSKALAIIRESGLLGFIVPNTWLLINNAKEYRRNLLSLEIKEIIDHGDGVFKQATVESCTLLLQKSKNPKNTCRAARFRKGVKVTDHMVDKNIWLDDDYSRINIDIDKPAHDLLQKLHNISYRFDQSCSIIWGIKPYQVGYGIPPQTKEMVKNRVYHATIRKNNQWKPLLIGSDVDRYTVSFPDNSYIKYGKWLMYPSNESLMLSPKIFMRQTSSTIRACYDQDKYYCQNSVFIIHSDKLDLKFLLGLLNSRLLGFVYNLRNPQTAKVFAEIKPSVIKELPIRTIDFDNSDDKRQHDKMVRLVDRMLDLHKQLAAAKIPDEKTRIQREISATDHQIDKLTYELYNLTEEEIKIVEGITK
jgi:type I restriction-modification system DNA methylase subunit